jgi:hypothetical protein
MSDCEDAIYSLEKSIEKTIDNLCAHMDQLSYRIAKLDRAIHELQKLHHIDNDETVCKQHKMLEDTYNKHQFAKKLILGEDGE